MGENTNEAADASVRPSHLRVEPPHHMHRRWWQKLLVLFNVIVIISCALLSYGLYYAKNTVNKLQKIALTAGTLTEESSTSAGGDPVNILLVGTDSSAGINPNDPVQIDRGQTQNTDTIMIMRIEPRAKRAAILSIQRDVWVKYSRGAGHGGSGKINGAAYYGDEVLVNTIKDTFGIPINHYIKVDFLGFKGLVDAIHGVPVYFPAGARDSNTGLFIPNKGCVSLTGDQALAYVRSRHYQYLGDDGRWHNDSTDDYGRIRRQQDFIRRSVKKAVSLGARNPTTMLRLIDAMLPSATFDSTFNTADKVFQFAQQLKDLDPDSIKTYQLATLSSTNGVDALSIAKTAENTALLKYFSGNTLANGPGALVPPSTTAGTTVPSTDVSVAPPITLTDPSQVNLQVINASPTNGLGASVSTKLEGLGFVIAQKPGSKATVAHTEIRYGVGAEPQAALLARYVSGTAPTLVPSADVAHDSVQLILGSDFGAVRTTPTAAASTTSTSPATTTTNTLPAVVDVNREFGPDPATAAAVFGTDTAAQAACV